VKPKSARKSRLTGLDEIEAAAPYDHPCQDLPDDDGQAQAPQL